MTIKNEEVGFEIQVIKRSDADLLLTKSEKYGELKMKLIAHIQQLSPDESFVFGLPAESGKTMEEREVHALVTNLNHSFKKSGLPWTVVFSKTEQKFFGRYQSARSKQSGVSNPRKSYQKEKYLENIPLALEFIDRAKGIFHVDKFNVNQIGAVFRIGINDLGFYARALEDPLGIKHGRGWYIAKKMKENEYDDILRTAMKG